MLRSEPGKQTLLCTPAKWQKVGTIVRQILLYGILIWWSIVDRTQLWRLRKVHEMASLCITGDLRTTPTNALDINLHLPPLDLVGRRWRGIWKFVSHVPNSGSSCGYYSVMNMTISNWRVDHTSLVLVQDALQNADTKLECVTQRCSRQEEERQLRHGWL